VQNREIERYKWNCETALTFSGWDERLCRGTQKSGTPLSRFLSNIAASGSLWEHQTVTSARQRRSATRPRRPRDCSLPALCLFSFYLPHRITNTERAHSDHWPSTLPPLFPHDRDYCRAPSWLILVNRSRIDRGYWRQRSRRAAKFTTLKRTSADRSRTTADRRLPQEARGWLSHGSRCSGRSRRSILHSRPDLPADATARHSFVYRCRSVTRCDAGAPRAQNARTLGRCLLHRS